MTLWQGLTRTPSDQNSEARQASEALPRVSDPTHCARALDAAWALLGRGCGAWLRSLWGAMSISAILSASSLASLT
eukprot:3176550-Alexandrium_andersonii.AAC.1